MALKTNKRSYMSKVRILDFYWRSLLTRKLVALLAGPKRVPF